MKKYIFSLIFFIIIFLIFSFFSFLYLKKYPVVENTKILNIPENISAKTISILLQNEKIIPSSNVFYILVKLTNNEKNLKSGEYKFEKKLSYYNVMDILIKGKIYLHSVLIPEGLNIYEIAEILEKSSVISKKEKFINFCFNKEKIKKFLNNGFSMEGYLFPDTYRFYKNEKIYKIVKEMNENFKRKVIPVFNKKNTYHTLNEVIILASIIQKETYNKKEMPIIASVFFNRLKRGMRLQSDPTVIYGLKDKFKGYLTRKDLKIYTVYNTYLNYGLPPTPICNPGISAIKAVLNPSKTSYLYFVSTGKGSHAFAKTYKEHLRNIKKFRR